MISDKLVLMQRDGGTDHQAHSPSSTLTGDGGTDHQAHLPEYETNPKLI